MSTTTHGRAAVRSIAKLTTLPALGMEAKIDVCRGLFAALVVVAHCWEIVNGLHPGAESNLPGIWPSLVRHTLGTGFYYVMGFFVLSGYCIQRSADRLGAGARFPLRTYTLARLSRILPLYYAALAFTVLAERLIAGRRPPNWPNGLDGRTLAMQVLGAQNLTQTFGSFAPSWSITNELFYYALFGLIAAAMGRRRAASAWAGMGVCVAVGGGALLAYRLSPGRGAILSVGLLFGLGFNWYLGALVAAYQDRLSRSRLAGALSRGWPLVLAASMLARADGRLRLEFVFLGCGVAFALMMVRFAAADAARGGPRPATPTPVGLMGLASYPIYLFHGPIAMLVGSILLRLDLPVGWPTTWLLMVAASLGAGLQIGVYIEAPMMARRAAWLRSRSSGVAR